LDGRIVSRGKKKRGGKVTSASTFYSLYIIAFQEWGKKKGKKRGKEAM